MKRVGRTRTFLLSSLSSLLLISASLPARADDDFVRAIIGLGLGLTVMQQQQQQQKGTATVSQNRGTGVSQRSGGLGDGLTYDQAVALQRGLQTLGYDPGPIDGQPGRKTGAALSEYLVARGHDPYVIPAAEALNLVQTEAGLSEMAGAAPAGAFEPSNPDALQIVDRAAILLSDEALFALYPYDANDFIRAHAAARDRLFRLYELRENPALLDDPYYTQTYLFFLPAEVQRRYTQERLVTHETIGTIQEPWIGRNQFEIEDTRQLFLREQRSAVMALTENLPDQFIVLNRFSLGDYDMASETFSIGTSTYHWSTLNVAQPYAFPETWSVPKEEARALVELVTAETEAIRQVEGGFGAASLFVAQHYKLEGVRLLDQGFTFDLSAIDIKVFDDPQMQQPLGVIPLPGNAVVAQDVEGKDPVASTASSEGTKVYPLDEILPFVWAKANLPGAAEKPGFLVEAFHARKAIEQRIFYGELVEDANRPRVIAQSFFNSYLQPTASDLEKIEAWLTQQAAILSTKAMVVGNVIDSYNPDGSASIVLLNKVIEGLRGQSLRASWSNWLPDASKALQASRPDVYATTVFPSGDSLPTVIAFRTHPAWQTVTLEDVPVEVSRIVLDLVDVEVMTAPGGETFLVIEVLPAGIQFTNNGGSQYLDLQASADRTAASASATGLGHYELGGVRLGMPLDEALPLARAFFEGKALESDFTIADKPFNRTDEVFDRGVELYVAVDPNYVESNLTLYYDASLEEKPVIAVSRHFVSEQDLSAFQGKIVPQLAERFGKAYPWSSNGNWFIWAQDPSTVSFLEAGGLPDACSHYDFKGAYERRRWETSNFYSGNAIKNCGETVSAMMEAEGVHIFLTDTDAFPSIRERRRAGAVMEAEAEPEAPKLKF